MYSRIQAYAFIGQKVCKAKLMNILWHSHNLMTKDILDMKMKGTETVEVLSAVSGG